MTAAIIAAFTALSLSAPSNYYFTTPATSNLTGRTYALTGGLIPRAEDISFLREAYAERAMAVQRFTNESVRVPASLLFGEGRFRLNAFADVYAMFAPSFGVWSPYYAYDHSFFLKRGISIEPDLIETGPGYAWDNGQDTSGTNTIRAWVNPASAAVPSNGLAQAELSGILSATNTARLFSSYNTNYVNSLLAAYSILTNQYNVLSHGDCWSHGERKVRDVAYESRSIVNEQYTSYTYSAWDGTRTGSRLVSFDLSSWNDYGYVQTNAAPFVASPYWIYGSQQKWRYYGMKYIYEGYTSAESQRDYYRVGDDYVSNRYLRDDLSDAANCGNALATCNGLDAPLTNTIEDVKCFLVCRFRIEKRDQIGGDGIKTNPPPTYTTNYYVTVYQGDATRTARTIVSSGFTNVVWDTGVPLLKLISDAADGLGVRGWAGAARYSTLTLDCDPPTIGYEQGKGAAHYRYAFIYLVDVYPYFYYRRRWNARLPEYDD